MPLHGWNEWNEEFDPSSSDDEDDDDIAQHKRLFQGIGGFRNEEVVDETSDDEDTDDERCIRWEKNSKKQFGAREPS